MFPVKKEAKTFGLHLWSLKAYGEEINIMGFLYQVLRIRCVLLAIVMETCM